MILRTICCDIPGCKSASQEQAPGAGWPGWGALQGIAIDGKDNPSLCPGHLEQVANFATYAILEIDHGSVD
jgi:hypothetical protein